MSTTRPKSFFGNLFFGFKSGIPKVTMHSAFDSTGTLIPSTDDHNSDIAVAAPEKEHATEDSPVIEQTRPSKK